VNPRPIRTAAGVLIVAALCLFLCELAGWFGTAVICLAGFLLALALAYAWVEDRRKQKRRDERLAERVKGRVA
jgi:UDP-N-acetylmuramyl pentapeptide phosphotransferase/UDP-N-acetylglucosamine-1-phosphate transferase